MSQLHLELIYVGTQGRERNRVRDWVAVCICFTVTALLVIQSEFLFAQTILAPGIGAPRGGKTVPSPAYDMALAELSQGNYSGALQMATAEYSGGIKAGQQRWIDAIASAMVVGECHYELGQMRQAVAAYDESLLLSAAHADWMLAVQFPDQNLRAMGSAPITAWGRSARNSVAAIIPDTMLIRQGEADPQKVLQKGGVLSAPFSFPIRPQEIIRSTVVSLYRRGDLLGPLARTNDSLDQAARALSRRPAPPNHWSQSWIDIALGTASWAQGKSDQAIPLLERGLLVGGQFDHPLTAWGLIVLGRIAMDRDAAAAAVKYFEEATYVAANYGDTRALEEAFRYVQIAHLAAGSPGTPPSIEAAALWARTNLPALRLRLLAMKAETSALLGDIRSADAALLEIDSRTLRGDMGRGLIGFKTSYAKSLVFFLQGAFDNGDRELAKACLIQSPHNVKLFRTERLLEIFVSGSGSLSDREADERFSELLADPTVREQSLDPLGTITTTSTPRLEAFDAWMVAALRRDSRNNEAFLIAGDAMLRSRWLSAQPLGGRRINTEWLFGTLPEDLDPQALLQRGGILARVPQLAQIDQEFNTLRTEMSATITQAAQAGNADGSLPGNVQRWKRFADVSRQRTQFLTSIASGRDPIPVTFPPRGPPVEVRRRLQKGQLMLSFYWISSGLTGVLQSNDRTALWQIKNTKLLTEEIVALFKELGVGNTVASISTERLEKSRWRSHAEKISELLFENSKVSLAENIDELVIIPDGLLWCLPFELLPVGTGDHKELLRDCCRVRYSPTAGTAVMKFTPTRGGGVMGLCSGKLFRGDAPEIAQENLDRLRRSLDRVFPLPVHEKSLPLPLVGSVVESLLVLDELVGEGPVVARPMVPSAQDRQGMTFGMWLSSPRKHPVRVILPGMQPLLPGSNSKTTAPLGSDIFMAVTDLLASGARTAIVSRWRMGGKITVDLIEEFLRDASTGDTPASESWQRSVSIVIDEEPDLQLEPRMKVDPDCIPADASHPLFWAGYLLADCGQGIYSLPPDVIPAVAKPMAAPVIQIPNKPPVKKEAADDMNDDKPPAKPDRPGRPGRVAPRKPPAGVPDDAP